MAARYAYECPECHSTIELSTTQAGQDISCSNCSTVVTAPKLGIIKSLPSLNDSSSSKSKSGRASNSGSSIKSWLFAGGLLLAVLAGIGGAAAQYRANQFHVEVDIEKIIAEEHDLLDKAPPVEIFAIAASSCDESFTLEYSEVPYRTLNIKGGIIQKVAWACFGVAGAGLLMLLSSLFLRS